MIARFHYDEKMLSRLLRDEPGSEVREIQEHVEKCDLCQTQLESLSAGDMTWDDVCDLMRTDDLFDYDIADAKTTPESKATFLEASEDPNSLGRFGRYEIQEVLGRGGMGIVMRGVDSALDRHCAIKVLAPELASSAAARKRFSREARSAAAVVHPHVVPIQTVDEQDGLPYLVMPVVEGQSLAQRVDANGPLEVVQTVRIAAQIADGLSAAHRQGLVHRDIKPANVLLENDVDRVQITDFGLARAVDDASMTRSGVIAGTPQYMSPEQAHGDTIDHRSDLFSLGSVMYFMLTGRSPFRAETSMGVLNRICNDQPRSLRSINAEVPEWLATIVTKLLEKSPDDRFQSANELANLLADRLTQMNNPDSGHRAALDDAESESEPKVSFAANPPNRLRRIVIAAGFAFVALAGTLFYLQTNKGTLQIESNSDLDVPVRIMSGDETVEQLTVSREGATTRLQAGNYVIEVDDADSHVEVKGDRFTLRRGETWIVSITPVTKSSGRGQEFNSGTEHMGDPTGSLMEEQMKHFMELHDSDGQMDGWPMGSDKGGSPMAPPGGLMGGGGTLGGHADGVDLPNHSTSTETEEAKENFNALKQRAKLVEERYRAGEVSIDQAMLAGIEVVEAALPLATNAEDRIQNLRRQVSLLKDLEKMLVKLHEAGEIFSDKVLSALADRVKAEARLSKELAERAEQFQAGAGRESEQSWATPPDNALTRTPDDPDGIEPNTDVPRDPTSETSRRDRQVKEVPGFQPRGFDTPEALMTHVAECQSRDDIAGLISCWTDEPVKQFATSYLMSAMMLIGDFQRNPDTSRPPGYAEQIQELQQILSDEARGRATARVLDALAFADHDASSNAGKDFEKSAEASGNSPLVQRLSLASAELLESPRRFVVRFSRWAKKYQEPNEEAPNTRKIEYSIEQAPQDDRIDVGKRAVAIDKSSGRRMGLIETDAGWMVDDLWPDADTAVDDAGKAILGDGTADLSEMLPGGPPRQDWKTGLQGRWHVEMKSYDDEGKLKSSTVQGHVMGNRITLTGDDGVPVSFAFEFGVDGPPKQIDLRPAITDDDEQLLLSGWDRESGNPPEALVNPTFHAIVKESKDGFEFCLPATPGERPSDFSISTDRGMWILRREPVKPSREALPKAKESHVRGAGKVVALVPQEQAQSVDSPVPDTSELAVELWISGNDAPLVQRGDRVRLQFEGWPPVDGGTFAGEVMTVDPTADGDGRFRLVVKADGKDSWPDERYLRPGVPAIGWVLTEDAKRIRRVIESLMPQ